jgi:hypothetical protein
MPRDREALHASDIPDLPDKERQAVESRIRIRAAARRVASGERYGAEHDLRRAHERPISLPE